MRKLLTFDNMQRAAKQWLLLWSIYRSNGSWGKKKKRKRNQPCSVAYKLQSFQSLCSDHTQHVLKMPESLYFSIEKNIPLVKM